MKLILLLLTTSVIFITSKSVASNAQTHFQKIISTCSEIKKDSERLACFDEFAEKLNQSSIVKDIEEKPTEVVIPAEKVRIPPKEHATAKNFGKPKDADNPISIQSTLVGEFKGWVHGQILELSNGQKWEVVSRTKGYTRLDSPKVEVSEAIFGSYTIRVEGFRPIAKVKRID